MPHISTVQNGGKKTMQEVQVEELVTDEDMTLLSWPFCDNSVTNRNHMANVGWGDGLVGKVFAV